MGVSEGAEANRNLFDLSDVIYPFKMNVHVIAASARYVARNTPKYYFAFFFFALYDHLSMASTRGGWKVRG